MKIIISIILLLIFIAPVAANELSDVDPNYTDEQIQGLLGTIKEGIECDMANDALKADLTYYKAINSLLSNDMPAVLPKIEGKIAKNQVLFSAFLTGLVQALVNTNKYTEEEIKTMLKEWTIFSNTKVETRKSIGYRDGSLEQHLVQTFKYLNKCRKWEKQIMGSMAPN
jgi:metal-dependent amidase/aminoacylase/carboxypeptidase family protein